MLERLRHGLPSMLNLKDLVRTKSFFLRVVVTALAIAVWFWTQSLIGARALPSSGIGDALHNLTAGLNACLQHLPSAANALLIVSSALIDALGPSFWGAGSLPAASARFSDCFFSLACGR